MALATAARLHAGGDSTGALEILPALVAARPDDLDARLLQARCLVTVAAPAVARAAAEAAVECDPSSWQAHILVARSALGTDPAAAVAAAERAVALAPAEPEAHRVLAEATTARGDSAVDALLDPARPDPLERERAVTPTLPRSLLGVTPAGPPEPTTAPPAPSSPARAPGPPVAPTPPVGLDLAPAAGLGDERRPRLEPVLPVALGGTGLGGGARPITTDDADRIGTGRLVFRIIGLVGWLLLGFRFGIQVVGGPVGLLLFVAVIAGVAYGARRVTDR